MNCQNVPADCDACAPFVNKDIAACFQIYLGICSFRHHPIFFINCSNG